MPVSQTGLPRLPSCPMKGASYWGGKMMQYRDLLLMAPGGQRLGTGPRSSRPGVASSRRGWPPRCNMWQSPIRFFSAQPRAGRTARLSGGSSWPAPAEVIGSGAEQSLGWARFRVLRVIDDVRAECWACSVPAGQGPPTGGLLLHRGQRQPLAPFRRAFRECGRSLA